MLKGAWVFGEEEVILFASIRGERSYNRRLELIFCAFIMQGLARTAGWEPPLKSGALKRG